MKSETSRNILLIALAVRLQRLVKSLPNNHISAERISKQSLAESYLSDELSSSAEGARKKASRYLEEMEQIFGLLGDEKSGFVMAEKFPRFRDMFTFWLDAISPPSKNDKRLHVMLKGLIHAIDNAFSDDPIVIPKLAKQLKEQYGNKNIRDTKEPLNELFDHAYISSWLYLIDADNDAIGIDASMDPLLLRLKSRSMVGSNKDQSINLARSGRIHVVFEHTLADLKQDNLKNIQKIAQSVKESEIWQINHDQYLPYLLFREGKDGPIMLTMRNLTQHQFEDIRIDQLPSEPLSIRQYIPYEMEASAWRNFKQILQ